MSEWSELVAGMVGAGLVLVAQTIRDKYVNRRDQDRIFAWLQSEFLKTDKLKHRSTRAISKALSLTPERVYLLCHTDVRVNPALGDRDDLWNLSGQDQEKPKGFWG